jgi:Flp pilus assembly protein TadD/4-amino-4-deoxy-L-arabinose transferase-like glycosyltransferase
MEGLPARVDRNLERVDAYLTSHKMWLVALFLIPLLLKLLYISQSADALYVRSPIMDSKYYDQLAQDIAAGHVMRDTAFFMGPLYPYFLAVIYGVVGRDITVVRVIQAFGGCLTVVMTYLLGRRLFRPVTALLGAVLFVLYGTATYYEGQLLMTWLGTLLNLTVLWLLLRIPPSAPWHRYVPPGAVLGLSVLARANILVIAPLVVVWVLWIERPARRALKTVAFCASVGLVILPATVHNFVASRDFVLVTSNAGLNFYIGNSENATGVFYPPSGVDFVNDATTRTYLERMLGRDLSPSQISRYWRDRAVGFIRSDPMGELKLLGRKAAMFFNAYEIPQIEDYYRARERSSSLRWMFVNFWSLCVLGVFGLLFAAARWRRFFLPGGYVRVYALSIIAFFITARYRVQIVPVLGLFAAYAILEVIPATVRGLRSGFAVAGLLVVLVFSTQPSLFAFDKKQVEYREHIHEARRACELGLYKQALGEIDVAIEMNKDDPEGYVHRAIIQEAKGDRFKAIEDYTRSLDLDPKQPTVQYDLAQTLRRVNLLEQAVVAYNKAIELDPVMIEAYNNLGTTLAEMKEYKGAIKCFNKVIDLDPGYTKAYNNLGAALAEAGRPEEAVATFEKAIERDKGYANTYKNLAMAYVSMRRIGPAIDAITRYLTLEPGDENAREMLRKLRVAAAADTSGVGNTE